MPSWIQDIQGYTTILDENGDPVQRRHALQVVGATVTDNGSVTLIEVPPGATGTAPAASDTEAGIIEIATAVEANALSDTTRAVTPGRIPLATDTQRGVIEIATAAEADALSDTTRAVTPGRIPLATDTQRGVIEIATAAEQETGTDTTRAVTPGRQHAHPSAAKWWACVRFPSGSPVLTTSYNVTSITDTATGRLQVNIATNFSSADWVPCVTITFGATTGSACAVPVVHNVSAGTVELHCRQVTAFPTVFANPTSWFACGFGDQ